MSTKFFSKRKFFWIAIALSFCTVYGSFAYSLYLSDVKTVAVDVNYYFLVSEDKRVAASQQFVKQDGGAGYFLDCGKTEYVAISVYANPTDGETVKKELEKRGRETKIVRMGVETLYFKGGRKKHSNFYVSALKLLQNYVAVLGEFISRLEKGMTQEGCRRALTTLCGQFAQAREKYTAYAAFRRVSRQSEKMLTDICADTIYLTDLRYLLCWQAEKCVELCKDFLL